MLPDLVEADREFRAQLQLGRGVVHWYVVERPEHQPFRIVAGGDAHPHPLAHSRGLVGKLNLDVIATLVFCHAVSPQIRFKAQSWPSLHDLTEVYHSY